MVRCTLSSDVVHCTYRQIRMPHAEMLRWRPSCDADHNVYGVDLSGPFRKWLVIRTLMSLVTGIVVVARSRAAECHAARRRGIR
jgi:hypothetical protein